MFYYDRGQGEAVLLTHGLWGDHLDWQPVLDPLSQSFRVIAVDLPGFGRSEPNHIEYTAGYFTHHLIALLDSLRLEKISVIGNSFGGQIAMCLTMQIPERIEKLVLVATGGLKNFSRLEKTAALLQRDEKMLRSLTPAMNASLFARLFFLQNTDHQRRYIEKQNARLARTDYPQYVHTMRECMRLAIELCLVKQIPSLNLPVLLIQGEHDPIVKADWVRKVFPSFRDAHLSIWSDCAHVPQLEQPERFVTEVKAFLNRRS